MLVIRALVPSASVLFPVERERAHLHRIVLVEHEHRRRHVVPRAQQTHNLGFGRVELQINGTQAGARIEPGLVNARREKFKGLHLRTLLEIRMLRPLVAAAQNLEVRHLRAPLRRAHQCIVERVMTPEAVFPFGAQRSRLVKDIVPDRDVESAVAVARVVAPRVVNMQHARIIKAHPSRRNSRRCSRRSLGSIDIDSVVGLERGRKVNRKVRIGRDRKPRSLVTREIGRLRRVSGHHRRSHRAVDPATFRVVARNKAHQHRIHAKVHLRERLVAPGALEPHHLRARSHERLGVLTRRGIRVQPNFGIRTEKTAYREFLFATGIPIDAGIVVEIDIGRVGAELEVELHPFLEIGQGLAGPRVHIPVVALFGHDRLGSRPITGRVITASTTQNMRDIIGRSRIITKGRLDMHGQIGPCNSKKKEKNRNYRQGTFHKTRLLILSYPL